MNKRVSQTARECRYEDFLVCSMCEVLLVGEFCEEDTSVCADAWFLVCLGFGEEAKEVVV